MATTVTITAPTTTSMIDSSFFCQVKVMEADRPKVERMIKEKFFSVKEGEWWLYPMQEELIKVAKNMQMHGLAEELTLFTQ